MHSYIDSVKKIKDSLKLGLYRSPVDDALSVNDLVVAPARSIERSLLAFVAQESLGRRAGYVPQEFDLVNVSEAANPEQQAWISRKSSIGLYQLYEENAHDLIREFYQVAQRQQCILRPFLLPRAMDHLAKKHFPEVDHVRLFGERGKWLAALNEQWAENLYPEIEQWRRGDTRKRLRYFLAMSLAKPKAINEMLVSVLEKDSSEMLAKCLKLIQRGIHLDSAFLESLLDHRKQEVRLQASRLLATLEDSGYVARMKERLHGLLLVEKEKGDWQIKVSGLPEIDKGMERDQLHKKRYKLAAIGNKSEMLVQMLAAVPLSYWSGFFGLEDLDFVKAIMRSEWRQVLLMGALHSALNYADANWSYLLLSACLSHAEVVEGISLNVFPDLYAMIPAAKADAALASGISRVGFSHQQNLGVQLILEQKIKPGDMAARNLLKALVKDQRRPANAMILRRLATTLPKLGNLLPISLYIEYASAWQEGNKHSPQMHYYIEELLNNWKRRYDMLSAIKPKQ